MDVERKRFEIGLVSRCREKVRDYLSSGAEGDQREEVLVALEDASRKLTGGFKYWGEIQNYIEGVNNGTLCLSSVNR